MFVLTAPLTVTTACNPFSDCHHLTVDAPDTSDLEDIHATLRDGGQPRAGTELVFVLYRTADGPPLDSTTAVTNEAGEGKPSLLMVLPSAKEDARLVKVSVANTIKQAQDGICNTDSDTITLRRSTA